MSVYRVAAPMPSISDQMLATCELLHDWRKFDPMVAGGALWAWAASTTPRDIDIWIRESIGSRWKAVRLYGCATLVRRFWFSDMDGYDTIHHKIKRYSTKLCKVPTDVLLAPLASTQMVYSFDYRHCQVGFGPTGTIKQGAYFYAKGELQPTYAHKQRADEVIRAKLTSLWGNPKATAHLDDVLVALDEMYDTVSRRGS